MLAVENLEVSYGDVRALDGVSFTLEKGKTHYTSNLGLIELRRAINKYVEQNFNVSYAPENEVIITVGVSEGLDLACRALINPGDKVMYHQPCYVSYSPSITLAHGIPVPVPTFAKDGFALGRGGEFHVPGAVGGLRHGADLLQVRVGEDRGAPRGA